MLGWDAVKEVVTGDAYYRRRHSNIHFERVCITNQFFNGHAVAVGGATPGGLVGQTGGSDLNFKKNQAVSTLLKTMLDFDIHNRNVGSFARVDGWDDRVLGRRGTPYGNYPSRFTARRCLVHA